MEIRIEVQVHLEEFRNLQVLDLRPEGPAGRDDISRTHTRDVERHRLPYIQKAEAIIEDPTDRGLHLAVTGRFRRYEQVDDFDLEMHGGAPSSSFHVLGRHLAQ
jgi:hypothetical protein